MYFIYKVKYEKHLDLIHKSYKYISILKSTLKVSFYTRLRYDGHLHESINIFSYRFLWGSDYEWIDNDYEEYETLLKLIK